MHLQRHSNTLIRGLLMASLSIMLTACGGGSSGVATAGGSSTSGAGGGSATSTGSINLQWTAPVTRTDGTPLSLSEIGGYRVHYGTSAGNYSNHVDITNGSLQSAKLTGVPVGTYYLTMTTYDTSGLESSYSASIIKQAL